MKADYTYKKGDLVVYVGFVLSSKKPEPKFNLGKVVEVGIHEFIGRLPQLHTFIWKTR